MHYHIQLDTMNQLFVAIDNRNANHYGVGRTIEQAIHALKVSQVVKQKPLHNVRAF